MEQNALNFAQELQILLNKYSVDNQCSTPDFILADYIRESLKTFDVAIKAREKWFGRELENKEEGIVTQVKEQIIVKTRKDLEELDTAKFNDEYAVYVSSEAIMFFYYPARCFDDYKHLSPVKAKHLGIWIPEQFDFIR